MKEQIQRKIRQNLDEAEMTVVKQNIAKIMDLKHKAYNIWGDDLGNNYIWRDDQKCFIKYEGSLEDV